MVNPSNIDYLKSNEEFGHVLFGCFPVHHENESCDGSSGQRSVDDQSSPKFNLTTQISARSSGLPNSVLNPYLVHTSYGDANSIFRRRIEKNGVQWLSNRLDVVIWFTTSQFSLLK